MKSNPDLVATLGDIGIAKFYDFAVTRSRIPGQVRRQLRALKMGIPVESNSHPQRLPLRSKKPNYLKTWSIEPEPEILKQYIYSVVTTSETFHIRTISLNFVTTGTWQRERNKLDHRIYRVCDMLRQNGLLHMSDNQTWQIMDDNNPEEVTPTKGQIEHYAQPWRIGSFLMVGHRIADSNGNPNSSYLKVTKKYPGNLPRERYNTLILENLKKARIQNRIILSA